MKKIFLILFLLASKLTFAQILNNGFEVWDTVYTNSYSADLATQFGVPNPVGGVINSWTYDIGYGISRTTDSYSGNYSLILHNWYSYVYQSIIYNDSISNSPLYLQGYFKYNTGGPDGLSHGNAIVTLTHFNGISNDTVATGNYSFDSTANYTAFQIPINYISAIAPDSIHIYFINGNNICIGNIICNLLYLDNLTLSDISLNVEKTNSTEGIVSVYPNPSSNEIHIQINSSQSLQFSLYNSLGKKIIDKLLTNNSTSFNLSTYPNGIYFYKLSDENDIIKSGKIIKH